MHSLGKRADLHGSREFESPPLRILKPRLKCRGFSLSIRYFGSMATILLQTTIPYTEDDWHVGRFSLLRDELIHDGHNVIARNREPDENGDDPILSTLKDRAIDELWLMAVDTGGGLSQRDVDGILAFREAGGGILTARDHADLGLCVSKLGSLGLINHFHSYNPERDPERLSADDQDNPNIGYPNYHSGANGDYQQIELMEPIHDLLRSDRAPNGRIEFFPAHPHEGAVDIPDDDGCSRIIARGKSVVTGRTFNIAVTIDGEACSSGGTMGRAVAESTFHHFADLNWDPSKGSPSFVKDKPGTEIKDDPSRLETFKEYVRNIARWLTPRQTSSGATPST